MQSSSKVINANNASYLLRQNCPLFIINGSNNNIAVRCNINTLTINGHNNNINYQAHSKSENVIVNGHNNNLNTINANMVTINGSNNSLYTQGESYVYSNGVNNSVHQSNHSNVNTFIHQTSTGPVTVSSHGITEIINGTNTFTINIEEDDKDNVYELDDDSDDDREEPVEMYEGDAELDSDIVSEEEEELYMPEETVYNPKSTGNSQNCIICMEPLKKGELVRVLECAHMYHSKCIDKWVQESNTCPMCKTPVAK